MADTMGAMRAGWTNDEPDPAIWRDLAARAFRLRTGMADDGCEGRLVAIVALLERRLGDRMELETAKPRFWNRSLRKRRRRFDQRWHDELYPHVDAMTQWALEHGV